VKIRFKRLLDPTTGAPYTVAAPEQLIPPPLVATELAAAADFYAAGRTFIRVMGDKFQPIPAGNVRAGDLVKYNTGMALEIPPGYFGLACARSSICKMPLTLANSVGIIDADYRGEMNFFYRILDAIAIEDHAYKVGERCGQLLILKHETLEFEEASELGDTQRGTGGYGSTGK
jgi:dUTPase